MSLLAVNCELSADHARSFIDILPILASYYFSL